MFGSILAARPEAGLEGRLRGTQYGFRKGRSTAEPMHILRRLQDLVHAKQHHALRLIFLDWSKAFDKVDTRCLPTVLKRFGVPEKAVRVVAALVKNPRFTVSMQGDDSDPREQETGIRQGCTLSPFLFTLIMSAIMQDVETGVRADHPMATTPIMTVMDLEYADDTVLLARTAELAELLLVRTEGEARRYGLRLNMLKTCRLAYNSEQVVRFEDGTQVPRVSKALYLGTLMHQDGDPGRRSGPGSG